MQPQDPNNPQQPVTPQEYNPQATIPNVAPQAPIMPQPEVAQPQAMPPQPQTFVPEGAVPDPSASQQAYAASQPQPQYQQLAPEPAAFGAQDPGKTLSLIGIFLFIIPIIGISLSIVGMMKSKQAGYNGKLGKIGIGVNIASIVLSFIVFVVLPVVFTKNAADRLAQDVSNRTAQTQTTSASQSPTAETTGLVVGASKAEVTKSLGMEPSGCVKVSDTSETCAYRDGTGGSNSTILVNATFVNGKLSRATGFTDSGAKAIKVGS
jgi:hypothetical protein